MAVIKSQLFGNGSPSELFQLSFFSVYFILTYPLYPFIICFKFEVVIQTTNHVTDPPYYTSEFCCFLCEEPLILFVKESHQFSIKAYSVSLSSLLCEWFPFSVDLMSAALHLLDVNVKWMWNAGRFKFHIEMSECTLLTNWLYKNWILF